MAKEETELSHFLSSSLDYVIVGGGSAGLVLATRLSEDPTVHVGVLEAGKSRIDDENVDSPQGIPSLLHNPEYDWALNSIPQPGTDDRVHVLSGGKMLGGSSGINFMCYCQPLEDDINIWGQLGNVGWSWDELAPYFQKTRGGETELSNGHVGSIKTCFPSGDLDIERAMLDVLNAATGGERPGFYRPLSAIEYGGASEKPTRSYASTGYLAPNVGRANLHILSEATVCRILFESGAPLRAQGVEFCYGGAVHNVSANVEVILSAGTFHSPQILELSGIGDPDVLNAAGIDCRLPLVDVGNNLREHPMAVVSYNLRASNDTAPPEPSVSLREPISTECLVRLVGFLPYASLVAPSELDHAGIAANTGHNHSVYQRALAKFRDPQRSLVQLIGHPGGFGLADSVPRHASYSLLVIGSHPQSQGSCHILSQDPFRAPRIDLGILSQQEDVNVLAAGVAFADSTFHSEHIVHHIAERAFPDRSIDLQDRDQACRFVRNSAVAFNHGVGTCSMGIVVDEQLRVKGVRGLRVVDASVIPLHMAGNPMSTVYALAERASDLIKLDTETC
ncbi:hypothetical protein EYZ11_007750 [Aspergillus tanneri]|uniref:Glucose-methanol-choline oxidoreductase N-terminal domain-containing protein n=1 Tax=Aspergillus tanneri TaxID=1220188 RepID=A0A4S3JC92_9EURO|nr:hypothetical protein EYZ11_007750 [Aspergillus tanneri]